MNYNKLEKLEPSFICSNKCWGVDNYDGSCCTIENRDFIIGPHPDADEFVERLSLKFGKQFKKENVFIDYEKGKLLFPNKQNWQMLKLYKSWVIFYYWNSF